MAHREHELSRLPPLPRQREGAVPTGGEDDAAPLCAQTHRIVGLLTNRTSPSRLVIQNLPTKDETLFTFQTYKFVLINSRFGGWDPQYDDYYDNQGTNPSLNLTQNVSYSFDIYHRSPFLIWY